MSETTTTPVTETLLDVPVAYAALDAAGRILVANDAFRNLFGAADPHGALLSELLVAPRCRSIVHDLIELARSQPSASGDLQLADVGERWVTLHFWQGAGDTMHLLADERRPLDDRAHLELAVDRSPVATLLIGADIRATDANQRWESHTGLAPDTSLGHGWLAAIDEEARPAFVATVHSCFADGRDLRGRLRLVTPDGVPHWAEVSGVVTGPDRLAMLVTFAQIGDALEEARRAQELTRVLEATPDLVAILDASGRNVTWANEALQTHLESAGVDTSAISGARVLPLLDQWSQAHYAASALPEVRRTGSWQGELTFSPGGDDLDRPISALLVAHRDETNDIEAISMVARDLRDLREAEQRVQASEVRLAALVEHASDLVCVVSDSGKVVYASPALGRILGHIGLDGHHILRLVHPDDRGRAVEMSRLILAQPGMSDPFTFRVAHANGAWRHVEVVATNLCDNPAISGIVVNGRDITDRVDAAAHLERRANHDELTGLANRSLLADRLTDALRRAETRSRFVGVLFADLDRFKVVNDSLGHAAGDELLVEVASRIEQTVRPGDTVARLGGDEFVIIINEMLRRSDATTAAERVRAAIAQPITVGNETTVITSSIGIAIADATSTVEELLRDADTALYRAKEHGRDRADVFDDHLRDTAVRRHSVEQQLRRALDDHLLETWYQPVINLERGTVTGAEALVRMRSEDGELLVPGMFIEIAEDSGLINRAGAQVLDAACRRAASWALRRPDDPPSVAVNVSARQLADADFSSYVDDALRRNGLAPDKLSLELTESALIDANPITEQVLHELDALGVHLGLDDFGTGFSSLAYLKRFPIDFVKIDRSFTAGLGTDDNDTAIVRATIALAHSLGLRVVAEGIEEARHVELLRELKCDWGQGYLFSRPLPAAEFDELLDSW